MTSEGRRGRGRRRGARQTRGKAARAILPPQANAPSLFPWAAAHSWLQHLVVDLAERGRPLLVNVPATITRPPGAATRGTRCRSGPCRERPLRASSPPRIMRGERHRPRRGLRPGCRRRGRTRRPAPSTTRRADRPTGCPSSASAHDGRARADAWTRRSSAGGAAAPSRPAAAGIRERGGREPPRGTQRAAFCGGKSLATTKKLAVATGMVIAERAEVTISCACLPAAASNKIFIGHHLRATQTTTC